jgi:hypothetical protein
MVVGLNGSLPGARYRRHYDGCSGEGRVCNLLDRYKIFVQEPEEDRYRGVGTRMRNVMRLRQVWGVRQKRIPGATKGMMGFWVIGGIRGYKKMQMCEDRLFMSRDPSPTLGCP